MRNSRWVRVLAFFLLAFLITFCVSRLPVPDFIRDILSGFGPLISALICYKCLGTPNAYRITFAGVRPALTYALIALAILLPMALTHRPKNTFIIVALTQTVYCFGEEFGWRHYLQNATKGLNKWSASLLIGTAWFLWHYSWIGDPIRVLAGHTLPFAVGAPLCILLLSLLSLMFGDLVIKTRSILLPTIGHTVTKIADPLSMAVVFLTLLTLLGLWGRLEPGRVIESRR